MNYTNDIDELNIPKQRSMPFEQFFGEMALTPQQKKDRIALAEEFEDMLWWFFEYYETMYVGGIVDMATLTDALEARYFDVLGGHMPLDEEVYTYVKTFAQNVSKTTTEHSDEYYTSGDRARLIAENESLTCFNNYDYSLAVSLGRTQKRWVAMVDKKTRDSHLVVNGTTIPIDEPFTVGSCEMMYPHDFRGNAEEVINCRCSIEYL